MAFLMKTNFFLYLTILSLFIVVEGYPQENNFTSKNKKAIKYYRDATVNYQLRELKTAETDLLKTLKLDPQFVEAWLLLGDVYTELMKIDPAINAYEKAIAIDPGFYPPVFYFLGNLYYTNGMYAEAVQKYEGFLSFNNSDDKQRTIAGIGLKKSVFALNEVQHPKISKPDNLGKKINTSSDEYINFVNEDLNKLVFTRKILVKNGDNGNQYFRESIFSSNKINGDWEKVKEISPTWQQGLDMGGMNISVDGRKMYFTGCNWPSSYGSCDIFVSYKNGDNWEPPFNLGEEVNSQWWDSQPAISSDGKKIYFASKRAGGKGGSDIWMTIRLANGKWSRPLNMGDSINSSGDEMAPFIHADGKTLYFSSNGRQGLGGFDLFFSKQNEAGIWNRAKNLGYPINTNAEEINLFLSIDGQTAWISSDREGGEGGFDIYSFSTYSDMMPQAVFYIKGTVSDSTNGKKLAAKVEVTNLLTGLLADSVSSDVVNGEFLVVLHPGTDYAFNISRPGYLFYSENFNLKDSINDDFVSREFKLSPIQTGNSLVLNNIFFDFNSSVLKPSSFGELDKLTEMLKANENVNILIEGHTDNIGSEDYNKQLSAERAKSVYDYLVSKRIAPSRMKYEGSGSEKPVDTNETEQGRAKNRRTEIVIL